MRENTVQVEGVQKEKYQKSRVDEEEVITDKTKVNRMYE